jgi:hypothetical protein
MLNFRIYRAALLFALAAMVVVMFSVVSRPEAVRSSLAADAFDGVRAAGLDRALLQAAPDRTPGSSGDSVAAKLVKRQFSQVQGGQVSEQAVDGTFGGTDVKLHNVTLVVPGAKSDRRIVVVAPRDCAGGPCAVSSGAASAALMELAHAFDGAQHNTTLVFVSTDGSVAGAAGAKALGAELAQMPADAVIVLSQPGASRPSRPFVVPWSAGPDSASIQLVESAETAVTSEAGGNPLSAGTIPALFRLAVPAGLGEQAPLIQSGIDAVAISSAGERPLPESSDGLNSLSAENLGNFGRAAMALTLALDQNTTPLEHGPSSYLPLAGKLIPGWSLALLALALLLPVGLVSIDGIARASRAGEPVLQAVAWVLGRAVPFLAALVLAYLMAAVGLLPAPAFPFDPVRFSFGIGAALDVIVLLAGFAGAVFLAQRLKPPSGAEEAIAPATGIVLFVAALGIWLANPYLALILIPTVHLWLFASLPDFRGHALPVGALLLAGLILPCAAILDLGGRFGVGLRAPWDLLLMFTGGHFGPLTALPLAALGGCLLAIIELTLRRRESTPAAVQTSGPRLSPLPGPGSLGGPPSTPATRR